MMTMAMDMAEEKEEQEQERSRRRHCSMLRTSFDFNIALHALHILCGAY